MYNENGNIRTSTTTNYKTHISQCRDMARWPQTASPLLLVLSYTIIAIAHCQICPPFIVSKRYPHINDSSSTPGVMITFYKAAGRNDNNTITLPASHRLYIHSAYGASHYSVPLDDDSPSSRIIHKIGIGVGGAMRNAMGWCAYDGGAVVAVCFLHR